jgi:hypothetical protein
VEYSWVNFSGAGLSLALMGLGSFDEVGPNFVGFQPPYAAVYGFSYVFDTKLASADSLAGVTSVPPDVDDTCYTTFSARGPMGSFKTVDVGSWLEFRTTNDTHDGGMRLDRTPGDYPANPQDLFIYYLGFDYYGKDARYGKADYRGRPGVNTLEDVLLRPRNFPFGEEVEFRFPGAVTSQEAPVASLPLPSSAVEGGNTRFSLPQDPGGVHLSWNGPRYDSWGRPVEGDGAQATCLSYAAPSQDPSDEAACRNLAVDGTPTGQMYTGPWDTSDGRLHFQWTPGTEESGYVSLAIRFLGPVDREDPAFAERIVRVTPGGDATRAWSSAVRDGDIPSGLDVPEGRRAPQACEEGEVAMKDSFLDAQNELVPALRGDPFNNVAEVTCRLKDDGDYTLTAAQLEQALTYARRSGAEGAIFFFARSTEAEAVVPAAKGQFGQRKEISPIKLTSRAIDIGRFWLEE